MRWFLTAVAVLFPTAPILAADWIQFGYDAAHSGNNTVENSITQANVSSLTLRYSAQVTGGAGFDGAPVYASTVASTAGVRDMLFAVSTEGELFAIDATNGGVIWSQSTGESDGLSGTSASPAIDRKRGVVYSYGIDGHVHRYRLQDGFETTTGGWPQVVTLKFWDRVSSSLTMAIDDSHDYLYIVTASYGDASDYQGHLTSIDLDQSSQHVFNVMCSNLDVHFVRGGTPGVNECADIRGGMWGRAGAVYDKTNHRVYIVSGNGKFDANAGGFNWGDSILSLPPSGAAQMFLPYDSYTPTTYADLDHYDTDLGSRSLALIPTPSSSVIRQLGAHIGKDGQLRLIDLTDMSGTGTPGHVGGEVFSVPVFSGASPSQPAVWVDSSGDGSPWLFIPGAAAYKVGFDAGHPSLQSKWNTSCSSSAVIANAVFYDACIQSFSGSLHARDARTGTELWSANVGAGHWQSPIVIDSAVYITDNSGALWKFALPLPDIIFNDGFDG